MKGAPLLCMVSLLWSTAVGAQSDTIVKSIGTQLNFFIAENRLDYRDERGRHYFVEDKQTIFPGFSYSRRIKGKTVFYALTKLGWQRSDFFDLLPQTAQLDPQAVRGDIASKFTLGLRYGKLWTVLRSKRDRFIIEGGFSVSPSIYRLDLVPYISRSFPFKVMQLRTTLEGLLSLSYEISDNVHIDFLLPIIGLRQDITHSNISDPTLLERAQRFTELRTKVPLDISGFSLGVRYDLIKIKPSEREQ